MKKLLLLLMFLSLPACGHSSEKHMLIIGDSISIGYTPTLTERLTQYKVKRIPVNGSHTRVGVANIDEWLSDHPGWECISFNFGLHDLSHNRLVPIDEYESNLRIISERIKQATPHPVFILTTTSPANETIYKDSDVIAYNEVAIRIMTELGIPMIDAYGASLEIPQLHLHPDLMDDVHYTAEGYRYLGEFIVNEIDEIY